MKYSKQWEEEDKKEELSNEYITLRALVRMRSSIYKDLQFKGYLPEHHFCTRCPMLDYCTWVDRIKYGSRETRWTVKVNHSFFQKKVANNSVIMIKSTNGTHI